MSLTTMSFQCLRQITINATKAQPGFNPIPLQDRPKQTLSLASSIADNLLGGSSAVYAAFLSLNASANITLDLTAVTNLDGVTLTLARIKFFDIQLLGINDSALDGTVGTAASDIVVGNAASNQWYAGLDAATDTLQIDNSSWLTWVKNTATGWVVDATHKNLKIVNGDGGVGAKFQIIMVGGTL